MAQTLQTIFFLDVLGTRSVPFPVRASETFSKLVSGTTASQMFEIGLMLLL